MNKWQLIVVWIAGLLASWFFSNAGQKLLVHTASNPETLATGYPFTLIAGTVWTYVVPTVIIGTLLAVTLKNRR